MRNDYIVKKVYQSFLLISILSALTVTAGMLIDNIVIGQFLGTDALGAMGVVSPVGLIFSAVGNISSAGGTALAAQALGKRDKEKLNQIFSLCLWYVFALGGILTVVGLVFTPQIASILGARGELAEPTVQYLRGYFLGAIPTIMMPTLSGFVKIDGSAKTPLAAMAVMSIADVLLDLVMALVVRWGMFGMALATTISYCLAVGVCLLHFKKDFCTLKFIMPKNIMRQMRSLVVSGAPTAVSRICNTFETMIFNNLLVTFVGVGAVTALNVRTQTYNIAGTVALGVGQALLPVAGMFYGEEDEGSLKDTMRVTLRTGFVLCIVVAVALFIGASFFGGLLGVKDPEIMEMANIAIRLYAVSMPFQLFNLVWMNFYQSTKQGGLAIMICVLQSFVYAVLAGLGLIRPLGSNGIWLALLIGEVLTALTLYIYIACKNKKVKIGVPDYMLLRDNFGEEALHMWEHSIGNDMEEVMKISEKITQHADEDELNEDTRELLRMLALIIEEMAGNIIQHAFKEGEKRWFDLKILDKEECMIVRLRDNGQAFDPRKYLQENKEAGPEENLGLRMISNLVFDMEYSRTLSLNNLLITVQKQSRHHS